MSQCTYINRTYESDSETLQILDVQLKLYLSITTMNPCKGVKRKAEAPSLSSWTLYLQAGLISGGWHPWSPEQVGEDLQRDDAKGTPRGEHGDSR